MRSKQIEMLVFLASLASSTSAVLGQGAMKLEKTRWIGYQFDGRKQVIYQLYFDPDGGWQGNWSCDQNEKKLSPKLMDTWSQNGASVHFRSCHNDKGEGTIVGNRLEVTMSLTEFGQQHVTLEQFWYEGSPLPARPVNQQSKRRTAKNGKDGQIYVSIPGGSFTMGCGPSDVGNGNCSDASRPPHRVTLTREFWMGQTEVTVAAYSRFAKATGSTMPNVEQLRDLWKDVKDDGNMPVGKVSWKDASDYCRWVGGRLPTEAEWEYAARGGMEGLTYPWGFVLGPRDVNVRQDGDRLKMSLGIRQVGTFNPNGYGLFDIIGNVGEWVNDWFDEQYYRPEETIDPQGPAKGRFRVVRGNPSARLATRDEEDPSERVANVGFRCALDSEPPTTTVRE